MGGMGGFNPLLFGGGGAPAQADTRPPRERFATQLQQIKEMGFHDEETILQILTQTDGNVNLTMQSLFSSLGGN
jgi:ubiquilin